MNIDSAIFYTHNIEQAKDFYIIMLGFTLEYEQAGKYLSFIFPNNVRLGIKLSKEAREVPGHQTVFIADESIEKHYDEVKSKGVKIYKELTTEEWGKNFS